MVLTAQTHYRMNELTSASRLIFYMGCGDVGLWRLQCARRGPLIYTASYVMLRNSRQWSSQFFSGVAYTLRSLHNALTRYSFSLTVNLLPVTALTRTAINKQRGSVGVRMVYLRDIEDGFRVLWAILVHVRGAHQIDLVTSTQADPRTARSIGHIHSRNGRSDENFFADYNLMSHQRQYQDLLKSQNNHGIWCQY